MAHLEQDTIYYSAAHPTGFIFGAGTEPPSAEDGWVLDPEEIQPGPDVVYECSTLAAFQALVDSERPAARAALASIETLKNQLRASEGHRMVLMAECARLNALLDAQQDTSEEPN